MEPSQCNKLETEAKHIEEDGILTKLFQIPDFACGSIKFELNFA